MGKVFLVGAGPGDLKLITVKGSECIRKADVIIYDNLINKGLLNIAPQRAEIIYVGKKASQHALPQNRINELIVDKAKHNDVVVRLKGGDPFVFGRGGEEAEYLVSHNIDFEIVPGITSAIAVPAYSGIPLTHRDHASTFAVITGHEDESKETSTIRWHEIANGPDTLVFLMGIKNLPIITANLLKAGKDPQTPACIIMSGTLPEQKVVKSVLGQISDTARRQGVKPPGILVVGDVVGLREKLIWFERKPLFGKSIAITRAAGQSIQLMDLLSDKGACPVSMPTIEITPIKSNAKLTNAIVNLHSYHAVLFTSVNSVTIFFDYLRKAHKDARALAGNLIIPIGSATARALEERGITADYIPDSYTSEGVAELLKRQKLRGKRFLLPRAQKGSKVVVDYVKQHGGICDVVPIYRTSIPKERAEQCAVPDIVTFTSSSTVDNFIKIYGKSLLHKTLVASIGPVTSKTLAKHGVPVHIEAKQYDIPGLVQAIEAFLLAQKC
ncbi:MAG TPA: uroporphyrinogen-III C-methyltransferase [Syntrophorhabdaceae bacterium]|nr:uroporphyrinogen-III C-methyltransferase [Syntrophorhabdaceae bacterium]